MYSVCERVCARACTNIMKSIKNYEITIFTFSNLWSQMIAADIYSTFQGTSFTNNEKMQEIGSRYRETFLSLGGSCPTSEIFRQFSGRDPNPKALLTNLGLDINSNMLKPNK